VIRRSIPVLNVPASTVAAMTDVAPTPTGFLDAVGGLPFAPQTALAFRRAQELAWSDPARLHHLGRQSALLSDTARASLAASISAATGVAVTAEQIFFAPSARLAAGWAISGFRSISSVAYSSIETLAVIDACTESGLPARALDVDELGRVQKTSLGDLEQTLVVIQAANVEIGTTQDLQEFAESGAPLLVDASQCVGRIQISPHWSVLLTDARGWGGPAGLVVIVANPVATWAAPIAAPGGWLGSNANVPALVAAATALEVLLPEVSSQADAAFALTSYLKSRVEAEVPDVVFSGDPTNRLPHILNCSVLYVSGEALISDLDRRGFAVASGSACVADSDRASHVLVAIGAFTGGNVRISLPFGCTQATVDDFINALIKAVAALRIEAGR
jgi:cysteine desulfurase